MLLTSLFFFMFTVNQIICDSKNVSLIYQWNIPSVNDLATNPKVISLYRYKKDNYTLININSNIRVPNNINLSKKSPDGIYFNYNLFLKFYLFLTSDKISDKLRDDDEWIYVNKFFQGSMPFHVIVKREYIDDNYKLAYKGIYLDAVEYKFLLSRASQLMKDANI